jgi:catechol-2,3-dioxygenase
MNSPKKLAHVVLYSGQVQAMRDWYLNVLGARVVHENSAMAFLTYDEEHHRIAFGDRSAVAKLVDGIDGLDKLIPTGSENAGVKTPEHPNRGLAHIAFAYDSLESLLENYARLKSDGILPVYSINHGPTTSLYYEDPDGNQIELQIDNFETIQEGREFMESDSFSKNPVGVPVDPDELHMRLRNGESQPTLVTPWW